MTLRRIVLMLSVFLALTADASFAAGAAADPEDQAWEAVQAANRVAGYQAYLNEYPKGRYVGAAKVKLAVLQAQPAAAKPAGAAALAGGAAPATAVEVATAPNAAGANRWGITDADLATKIGTDILKKAGFPERRPDVLAAADAGDPIAQLLTALSYERGVGTFVDMHQRALWLKKAADQGLARARAGYAVVQIVGDDAPRDQLGGWDVLLSVARSGNAIAQYNASMLVLQGMTNKSGEKVQLSFIDRNSALAMLKQSAQAGVPNAQYSLGHAYMTGTAPEVPEDSAQARYWLSLAAAQGSEEAKNDLASLPSPRVASSGSSSGGGDTVMKLGVLGAVAAIAGKSGISMDQQAQVLTQVGTDLMSDGKTHATADGLIEAQKQARMQAANNALNPNDANRQTGAGSDGGGTGGGTTLNSSGVGCNTSKGAVVTLASKSAFTAAAESCSSVAPGGFIWGTDAGNGHGTAAGSCQSALSAAFDGKSATTACYCYQASNTSEASAVSDGDWICWVGEH